MELTDEQLQQLADMVAKKLADKGLEMREKSLNIASIDFGSSRYVCGESGDDIIIGSSLNDTLTGNSLNNMLTGGSGNDTLEGGFDDAIIIDDDLDNGTIIDVSSDSFILKSRDENQVLKKLSQETKESPEQIMRKALALIKIALYSEKEGATLAIVKDGKIINEMVGFLNSAE